jgi:hypothetical protein
MKVTKGIDCLLAAAIVLGVAAAGCQGPPDPEEPEVGTTDLTVETATSTKTCKIGSTTIKGLSSTSQACKDATSMSKTLASIGKPLHVQQETLNTNENAVLQSTFVAPGIDTVYSIFLQTDSGGGFFLDVEDEFDGISIYQRDAAEGEFVNQQYFADLTVKQTTNLIAALTEAMATRMKGSAARVLGGGSPDGDGSQPRLCVGNCAKVLCGLPFGFAATISKLRIPAIGSSGGNAEGKILGDACTSRGPTVIAKGTYCCQHIDPAGKNPDGKSIVKGRNCIMIDGDSKDGNKCAQLGSMRVDCVGEIFSGSEVNGCVPS